MISGSARFPITRTAFQMHHRQNPDAVGLLNEDHRIRKDVSKMSLGGWVEVAKAFGVMADCLDETLHFIVETTGEFRVNLRIILRGLRVFLFGFGMKGVRFQRPTILRIRWLTVSPGMPSTFPFSNSSRRRRISGFQASSISGSISPDNGSRSVRARRNSRRSASESCSTSLRM